MGGVRGEKVQHCIQFFQQLYSLDFSGLFTLQVLIWIVRNADIDGLDLSNVNIYYVARDEVLKITKKDFSNSPKIGHNS